MLPCSYKQEWPIAKQQLLNKMLHQRKEGSQLLFAGHALHFQLLYACSHTMLQHTGQAISVMPIMGLQIDMEKNNKITRCGTRGRMAASGSLKHANWACATVYACSYTMLWHTGQAIELCLLQGFRLMCKTTTKKQDAALQEGTQLVSFAGHALHFQL